MPVFKFTTRTFREAFIGVDGLPPKDVAVVEFDHQDQAAGVAVRLVARASEDNVRHVLRCIRDGGRAAGSLRVVPE